MAVPRGVASSSRPPLRTVAAKLTYLGLVLGPAVQNDPWTAPVCKYLYRSAAIARAGPPTAVVVYLYKKRVVPTLSYVAQFVPPEPSLLKKEHSTLAMIFKSPHCAFTRADYYNLKY